MYEVQYEQLDEHPKLQNWQTLLLYLKKEKENSVSVTLNPTDSQQTCPVCLSCHKYPPP